jgi:hypothetical protein
MIVVRFYVNTEPDKAIARWEMSQAPDVGDWVAVDSKRPRQVTMRIWTTPNEALISLSHIEMPG